MGEFGTMLDRRHINALDYFLMTIYDLDMVDWEDQMNIWRVIYRESGLMNEDRHL